MVHYVKKPNHRYYIQENFLKDLSSDTRNKPDLIVVYDKLKPWQFYNLHKELNGVEIWDLVNLILNIFDIYAGTLEAKLRIELIKIKHQIPFVKEYVRFSKLGEQVGFMGPGAYGYESLLKSLRRREIYISRRLEEIKRKRELQVLSRQKLGLPQISIIGYASVGKTTLYNTLTRDNKLTGPKFFKTLSPKSGLVDTPCGKMIITDTIGFVRKMPPEIIDVFHAVISEIKYSDAIILMTDPTDTVDEYLEKLSVSIDLLKRINVLEKPIIICLNKEDLVDREILEKYKELTLNTLSDQEISSKEIVSISALKGWNIDNLLLSLCKYIDHLSYTTKRRTDLYEKT